MRSISELVDMGLDVATAETGAGRVLAVLGAATLGIGALGAITATLTDPGRWNRDSVDPPRYVVAVGQDPAKVAPRSASWWWTSETSALVGVEWVIDRAALERMSTAHLDALDRALHQAEHEFETFYGPNACGYLPQYGERGATEARDAIRLVELERARRQK